jgi:hypothetical protein
MMFMRKIVKASNHSCVFASKKEQAWLCYELAVYDSLLRLLMHDICCLVHWRDDS